jgi:hypothetical protein
VAKVNNKNAEANRFIFFIAENISVEFNWPDPLLANPGTISRPCPDSGLQQMQFIIDIFFCQPKRNIETSATQSDM